MPCKNHNHRPWPKDGAYKLVIESCETACGWCNYSTKSANKLRVHARRHVSKKEDESLKDVVIADGRAGRKSVALKRKQNSIQYMQDLSNSTTKPSNNDKHLPATNKLSDTPGTLPSGQPDPLLSLPKPELIARIHVLEEMLRGELIDLRKEAEVSMLPKATADTTTRGEEAQTNDAANALSMLSDAVKGIGALNQSQQEQPPTQIPKPRSNLEHHISSFNRANGETFSNVLFNSGTEVNDGATVVSNSTVHFSSWLEPSVLQTNNTNSDNAPSVLSVENRQLVSNVRTNPIENYLSPDHDRGSSSQKCPLVRYYEENDSPWRPTKNSLLPSRILICPTCVEEVTTHSDLKKHQFRHTKPFVCSIPGCSCKEGFSTRNDLDRHKRMKHFFASPRKTGPYRCLVPDFRLSYAIWFYLFDFQSHLRHMHSSSLKTDADVEDMIRRGECEERQITDPE